MSTFIVTRRLPQDPEVVTRRFDDDPDSWLPRPVTEHGAHEFRSVVRAWWPVPLIFTVGGVWQRGNAHTRRLAITAPREEGLCMFRSITGELTVMNSHGGVTLRYNASDRPLEGRVARWLPSSAQAHAAAQTVLRHIAANLAEPSWSMP